MPSNVSLDDASQDLNRCLKTLLLLAFPRPLESKVFTAASTTLVLTDGHNRKEQHYTIEVMVRKTLTHVSHTITSFWSHECRNVVDILNRTFGGKQCVALKLLRKKN